MLWLPLLSRPARAFRRRRLLARRLHRGSPLPHPRCARLGGHASDRPCLLRLAPARPAPPRAPAAPGSRVTRRATEAAASSKNSLVRRREIHSIGVTAAQRTAAGTAAHHMADDS